VVLAPRADARLALLGRNSESLSQSEAKKVGDHHKFFGSEVSGDIAAALVGSTEVFRQLVPIRWEDPVHVIHRPQNSVSGSKKKVNHHHHHHQHSSNSTEPVASSKGSSYVASASEDKSGDKNVHASSGNVNMSIPYQRRKLILEWFDFFDKVCVKCVGSVSV
jgi:hypothetical protein